MWFLELLALLLIPHSAAQIDICNTTILGSTTKNGYNDFNIYLPSNRSKYSNDTFIRFSTCSSQTNFDTFLYLFNADKTNTIHSCDDYCSMDAPHCFENGRTVHQTIWDVPLDDLLQTQYIFEINGFDGQSGLYKLVISYECDNGISINSTKEHGVSNKSVKINTTILTDLDVDSDAEDINAAWHINVTVLIVSVSVLCCCSIMACVCVCVVNPEDEIGVRRVCSPVVLAIEHKNTAHVFKILFQVIVSGCSIVGSLALSNNLGLSNYDNGLMAITIGSVTVLLACWRLLCNAGDYAKNNNADDIFVLGGTILGATVTDAVFDIFQGIAAIREEEYTALSATMLVTATWMGVGEEIIEAVFEIGSTVCIECVDKLSDGSKYAP
eukprot:43411_1